MLPVVSKRCLSLGESLSYNRWIRLELPAQWSQLPRSTWRGYRRALDGEVKGGVASRGAGKGRLWRKGSRKGGRSRRATRQRALIPSFLPVNVFVNLIAVNQMDPYDSDSSDGGSEFPSQSTILELPFLHHTSGCTFLMRK